MVPKNHHHPPLLNLDLQRERQPHEHFLLPTGTKNAHVVTFPAEDQDLEDEDDDDF